MVLGHFIKENACTKFVMPMSDVPFFFFFCCKVIVLCFNVLYATFNFILNSNKRKA